MPAVKVVVRSRPLVVDAPNGANDSNDGSPIVEAAITMTDTTVSIDRPQSAGGKQQTEITNSKSFTFDTCYSHLKLRTGSISAMNEQQAEIFRDSGEEIVHSAFKGLNACVFAYGQTGSGKTFSMFGSEQCPGLIPRMCDSIFERVNAMRTADSIKSHKVTVSFLEIYNEKVRDLLVSSTSSPSDKQKQKPLNCRIREHPVSGPYVEGLCKHTVTSSAALLKWINRGMEARSSAETRMNQHSSRSHAIIIISLSFTVLEAELGVMNEMTSKLCLVDLAGSERCSTSQTSGERLREGSAINKSLSTLGLVIKALADKSKLLQEGKREESKRVFVPYRDSALTWLLKECLGGNSKTVMLATINPSADYLEETLSTLRYASRARNIINIVKVNEDPNIRIIKELREEIRSLKDRLALYEGSRDVNSTLDDRGDLITSRDVARLEALLQESTKLANLSWEQRHAGRRDSDDGADTLTQASEQSFPHHGLRSPIFSSAFPSRVASDEKETFKGAEEQFVRQLSDVYLLPIGESGLASEAIRLYYGSNTIGSDPLTQDIPLHCSDTFTISPSHAVIRVCRNSGGVFIQPSTDDDEDDDEKSDNNSRVYINGRLLYGETELAVGDRIMLSRFHVFQLSQGHLSGGKERSRLDESAESVTVREYAPHTDDSSSLVQIPHYEKVYDWQGRSYFVYHIYLTLGRDEEGRPATLHCCRRYRDLHKFYTQWKHHLPPLIEKSFPGAWSQLFSSALKNAEVRRRRLEVFLNAFMEWWLSNAHSATTDPSIDIDFVSRKLWIFSKSSL